MRISGTNVTLTVAGQTLSGDFSVEKTATATTITAAKVTLKLGNGTTDFVSLTNGNGSFVVKQGGIAGALSGHPQHPGHLVLVGAQPRDQHDDRRAGHQRARPGEPGEHREGTLRIGATRPALNILGQSLSGDFFFEQTRKTNGERVIRLAARTSHIFIGTTGSGTVGLASRRTRVRDAFFSSRTRVLQAVRPHSTRSGSRMRSRFPRTDRRLAGHQQHERGGQRGVHLRNDTKTLTLPAGPYLRVEVAMEPRTKIKIFDIWLSGTFCSSGSRLPASTA